MPPTKPNLIAVVASALVVILTGCAQPTSSDGTIAQFEAITDHGDWLGVVWTSDTEMVAHRRVGAGADQLVRSDLRNRSETEVPLPAHPMCPDPQLTQITRLPDGRLGFNRSCAEPNEMQDIAAVDLTRGSVEVISPRRSDFTSADYSWAPDMSRGLVSVNSSICAALAFVGKRSVEPLAATLTANGREWSLGQGFLPDSGAKDFCRSAGRAGFPAWSSSDQIAFLASPDSIGVDGLGRIDVPWNVYTMSTDGTNLQLVLRSIVRPRALVWDPRGEQLAVAGEIADEGGAGVFVFNPTRKGVSRVAREAPDTLAWSPDGRRLSSVLSRGEAEEDAAYQVATLELR